jgi:hypothetical protein
MVLAQTATGDPELREFADTIETERGHGTRGIATHIAAKFGLRDNLDTQAAADLLWTLTSPDITDRLVNRRHWGWDRYEHWLATTMADAILRQ